MVFCIKCGIELPEHANFCLNCGIRTPKGAKANVPIPYREMLWDVENQVEGAFLTASEELKNAINKARKEVTEAVNR